MRRHPFLFAAYIAFVPVYVGWIGPKINARYGDSVDFAVVTGISVALFGVIFWLRRRAKVTASNLEGR